MLTLKRIDLIDHRQMPRYSDTVVLLGIIALSILYDLHLLSLLPFYHFIFIRKVGDKPHMLMKVLKLVGPWLTWADWRKLESLNKAIHKWCQSKDAAMSLFGLWQERTVSLCEIGKLLKKNHLEVFELDFINPIPFVTSWRRMALCRPSREYLYRSLLELSDLEEKIVENAVYEGSCCVKSDSLPIRGDDQWLPISCDPIDLKEDCIPPYYFLERAVPKGLKIVLVGLMPLHDYDYQWGCRVEILNAVGRAAALELDGLIIRDKFAVLTLDFLGPFVSALQEQKNGEFESPLEILLFHITDSDAWDSISFQRYRHGLSNLRNQIFHSKLRNLKYLNMEYVNPVECTKDFDLENLSYACPNLQVLELGRYSCHNFPPTFK